MKRNCPDCGSEMVSTKRWKSRPNPRTGTCHNIVRFECEVCGMIDTVHGNESADKFNQQAAINEASDVLRAGIEPPKHNL